MRGRWPRRARSSRLEAVSSGPKTRKLASPALARMTSRSQPPSTRVASLLVVPGASTVDRVVAEVGQREVAQQQPAVGVRVGAHAALALGGQRRDLGARRGRARRTAPPGGTSASTPRARRGARGSRRASPAAPGGRGRCPPSAGRRPPWAPSSPWACAGRSSASAAARWPPSRAARLDRGDVARPPGRASRP